MGKAKAPPNPTAADDLLPWVKSESDGVHFLRDGIVPPSHLSDLDVHPRQCVEVTVNGTTTVLLSPDEAERFAVTIMSAADRTRRGEGWSR